MRAAIYWAPQISEPLWQAGCAWLGRDAENGAVCDQPAIPALPELTSDARRYGFHATLRAPISLATDWAAFSATAQKIAARHAPITLPPLCVSLIDGFLALTLSAPCPALAALAEDAVLATDAHRLPPGAAEFTRRRAAGLITTEENYFLAHGYPYVRDRWQFHMTLSQKLQRAEQVTLRHAAEAYFAASLAVPMVVSEIVLFDETCPGADMMVRDRIKLGLRRPGLRPGPAGG
jgi:hypothetical protein